MLKIYIEKNEKFGSGLQLHMVDYEDDNVTICHEEIIDFSPYDNLKAAAMTNKAVEMYNRKYGTSYTAKDVLAVESCEEETKK